MKAYEMQARARHQCGEPLHLPAGRQVNSIGDITMWVAPLRQGVLSLSITCPARFTLKRSLADRKQQPGA